MKVNELLNLGFTPAVMANGDAQISGVYCCDLLSIVMGKAPAAAAWVTVMGNVNSVAVASLTEVGAIILADGVKPEDCAEAYVPAAALLVMEWLQGGRGVSSLSAGDMTVRMDGNGGRLEKQAMELMAPWLKDKSFVFLGVKG